MKYYVRDEVRDLPNRPEFLAYLNPAKTAIVSIDMHEGHLSEDPSCPCPVPPGRDVVEPINDFHRGARELGIKVIHVIGTVRKSGIDDRDAVVPGAWRITMPEYFGPIPGVDDYNLEGSKWTELRTEVGPNDEFVRTKKRLAAFHPTDLDFLLRQMGVETVVFTGITTDCCILNAAFDASNRAYRVIVPRDTTVAAEPDLKQAALSIVAIFLGIVVDSEDLLSVWREAVSRPAEALTV